MKLEDYEDLVRIAEELRKDLCEVSTDITMFEDIFPNTGKGAARALSQLFEFCDKVDALILSITVPK